jgi:hypothetical protein
VNLVLLLGSGASLGAGLPGVEGITDRVLSGEGVTRHTDGTYLTTAGRELQRLWPVEPEVLRFVGCIRDRVSEYYAEIGVEHAPNYEDLAELTGQLEDSLSGEYENPGLLPLARALQPEFECAHPGAVHEVAASASNYVRDVAWRMLGRPADSIQYLMPLVGFCGDSGFTGIDICTLNHDTVLEGALGKAGLKLSDGFGHRYGPLRLWSDDFPEPGHPPIRLLKLHGSVDWFRFRLPLGRGGATVDVIASCRGIDRNYIRGADGTLLDLPVAARPELLVGTLTKILNYPRGIYGETHWRFRESLRATTRIVVCGYGFGDKAVNSALIDWMDRTHEGRLLVVDPTAARFLTDRGRPAARRMLKRWVQSGRASMLESRLEDADWRRIRDELLQ